MTAHRESRIGKQIPPKDHVFIGRGQTCARCGDDYRNHTSPKFVPTPASPQRVVVARRAPTVWHSVGPDGGPLCGRRTPNGFDSVDPFDAPEVDLLPECRRCREMRPPTLTERYLAVLGEIR